MLDIRWMRENREALAEAMRKLNAEDAPWEEALNLDQQRRQLLTRVEALRAELNSGSKEIGRLFREKRLDEANALKERMSAIGIEIEQLDAELRAVEKAFEEAMLRIPNIPEPDVPVAPDESGNVVVKEWGEKPAFDFTPLPHWELGPKLGIIDFERGVKLSGARFYLLKGAGARLQRALINWFLDVHINEHGYEEVYPPFMVRTECMIGTGNLPKFGDVLYRDAEEDFWFIPTAEVPLTNIFRDEIIEPGRLPIYFVANSPCFRREKVSAGKDVRGIKRVHQFQKVEMVKFVEPGTGRAELESLTRNAEELCERLGLPYRRVAIATGDLSFVAAIKYDIEVWAAGSQEWLECSSCSFFRDFQARRANIRYRKTEGAKPEFVHTLNGSGLALPRIIIAILENYQQADGSVVVPEVLRPYMGGMEVIRPERTF
ncbi:MULTISPECIES: serine--tRNA ligase [Caldilinea]|jgi:seryl-tRNA synthetase|uniref:Serine--tRNA ligase n=1 Tax=Caldilinea aerophila (strain DSM 14535 / JCM 11387 / NBRC 104270 / STL-6-O1) TaxID=926550 RepID=I0HZ58_CALAS|nr:MULTISPECIES: serine--tRNA ligase [Caldilinea]BAL98295.1 seryl-tRNA synthetase [Caldilinea aerophila DSM 14535 = NBRC 104270]GIV75116.1 MAG: serine--tRNA ligase [Caldilinea sp.]